MRRHGICPLAAVQVQLYVYRLTNNPVRIWLLPSERLHAATILPPIALARWKALQVVVLTELLQVYRQPLETS